MFINLLPFIIFAIYYFLTEGVLRKGTSGKSIKRGKYDKGSTLFVVCTFIFSFIILIQATIINFENNNSDNNLSVIAGTLLMITGLLIRVNAAQTLGAFYSRTLRTQTEQSIVQNGLYSVIRHPGYFGVFTMWVGAGLITRNWIALSLLMVVQLIGYSYRINKEEEMLKESFGKEYIDYMARTKRLIPFIY